MPRYLRKEFAGAKYHITVRGNGRRRIFLRDEDRIRFMNQLQESLEQDGVILYAYVLMDNHYHLLLETPRANVSRFMQRLNTAYGMYFRYRHQSPGHVLQGRFGGKLVSGDEYLLALTRYIHLNPVKTKEMKKRSAEERAAFLEGYSWSSYKGYIAKNKEVEFVDYRWRKLVGGTEHTRYRRYVHRAITERDAALLEALERSEYALGGEDFVASVETELRAARRGDRTDKDVRWPDVRHVETKAIKEAVCRSYGCEMGDLYKHGHKAGDAKRVAIGLACRLSGRSNRDIGIEFGGLSGGAISIQYKRFGEMERNSRNLQERVKKLLAELNNVA